MNFKFIIAFILALLISSVEAQNCPILTIKDALGNQSATLDCNYPFSSNNCLKLTANYPILKKTDSYSAAPIAFAPPIAFNQGTPVVFKDKDDYFSDKIDLPFSFCFYGKLANSLVISTNGFITFDLTKANTNSSARILGSLGTHSSVRLPHDAIYGVMQDLLYSINPSSEAYYTIVGSAPCRKFVINFYKVVMYGCNNLTATSQIVLSEGTNEIEIYVENKPLPCPTIKFPEAIIGILNENGTTGIPASNLRNTGVWEANNEAYKFSPTGGNETPFISWYDGNNNLLNPANTNLFSIDVCPQDPQSYTAKASYALCGGQPYEITDTFPVTFGPAYPVVKDYDKIFCSAPPQIVNLNDYNQNITSQNTSLFNFKFYSTQAAADIGGTSLPSIQNVTANSTFYVRVENKLKPSCFKTAVLKIAFISQNLLTNHINLCDVANNNVEQNYDLSLLNPKLFASTTGATITYYHSQPEANTLTNPIAFENITNSTQLWVNYSIGGCSLVFGPITFTLDPTPNVNTPINIPQINLCDINDDNLEPYPLSSFTPLITSDIISAIHFYLTYAEAVAGGTITELFSITEGNYKIYARVEFPNGCFSIAELNMDVVFNKVRANGNDVYRCYAPNQVITVDLDQLSAGMLLSPLTGITKSYHSTEYDAGTGGGVNPLSPIQSFTVTPGMTEYVYFVRFAQSSTCYTVRQIVIHLVHPMPKIDAFDVCDSLNNGTETITLSDFNTPIIDSQDATALYFSDIGATVPITTVNINPNATVYVQLTSRGCSFIYPIKFNLIKTPAVKTLPPISLQNVCNNNNLGYFLYDAKPLESQIYSGTDIVKYEYFENFDPLSGIFSSVIPDPTNIKIFGSKTFYIKVSFDNTTTSNTCFSYSKVTINGHFLPAIILKPTTLYRCDYAFDANETFDLNEAINGNSVSPPLFSQTANSLQLSDLKITYHKTLIDAEAGKNPVGNIQVSLTPSDYYYARFESKAGCYSTASILLKSKYPPKALLTTIPNVCDQDLDGTYDADLTTAENRIVQFADPMNHFTYHLTQSNAIAGTNAIANPKNFHPVIGQVIWFRVESIAGCYDVNYIDFSMGSKAPINTGPFTLNDVCDLLNDGNENLDLTKFKSQIYNTGVFEYYETMADLIASKNKISTPNNYAFSLVKNPAAKIFVKVSASGFCPNLATINISLKKVPIFTLPDYFFCPKSFVNITPDFSLLDLKTVEWISPNGEKTTGFQLLNVSKEGVYTVNVVGNNGCTYSTKFNVKMYEVPVITQLIPNGNSFTVIATGSKKILYSIDGIHWQESNIFYNLPDGVTSFYVKYEVESCLGDIKEGLVLTVPNVITPNGDGYNDTWELDNLDTFEGKNSTAKIYDRYGNLIFSQESNTKIIWDGYWLGRPAPTTSYWYVVTLPDGRVYTGWVFLKNRN